MNKKCECVWSKSDYFIDLLASYWKSRSFMTGYVVNHAFCGFVWLSWTCLEVSSACQLLQFGYKSKIYYIYRLSSICSIFNHILIILNIHFNWTKMFYSTFHFCTSGRNHCIRNFTKNTDRPRQCKENGALTEFTYIY